MSESPSKAARREALLRTIEEALAGETKHNIGGPSALARFLEQNKNESTESLADLSQQTNYTEIFGPNDDMTEVIAAYHIELPPPPTQTQSSGTDVASDSRNSSTVSLGKRKAVDSSTSSFGPFRPTKIQKPQEDPDANPFLSKEAESKPIDLSTPINFSPPHVQQRHFQKLPYGVQYEIARYYSQGFLRFSDVLYEDVTKLANFQTNAAAVPETARVILGEDRYGDDDIRIVTVDVKNAFARELASKSPWQELDREEEALAKSKYGGLGFSEDGKPLSWYGGKVLFHGKLQDVSPRGSKEPDFKLTLEPAELGPSNMFARRFGSKHFFRIKLTKAVLASKKSDLLINYLRRPLIICGCVFRAFYAKESNVFYVKTHETMALEDNSVTTKLTVPDTMSFLEFLNWHNSIDLNNNQTMAKFVSRFALGLSNSVPGLMVEQENIRSIDDIISPQGSNMTDGAGKINRWSLQQIRHLLNWEDKPTAIQTRIYGTKGLMIDDGANAEEYAYVEVTPSQRKIKFAPGVPLDPAHRVIDVLRASHVKAPCRLSVETIMCLAEGGVKRHVFLDLLKQGLDELVQPLLEWEGPDAMRALWSNVRRLGGVMAARRAREEAGLARVKGYADRNDEVELEDDEGLPLDVSEQRSVAWWTDEVSGCPSSLEETIMRLLDCGFTPQGCPVLRDKMNKFIKARIQNYIKTYRIDVPMSASAFLIPDTSGLLQEGEVFLKSSRRELLTPHGETDIYVGDVLVTRHPCKLPTDIQKMKSVDVPELHHLTDVIIFSTKGSRRAADLLAGGDYDGDKGTFIIEPSIVQNFKQADLKYADPPPDINSNFARENTEVVQFQKQIESTSVENQIRQFQRHLLGAVRNTTVVGKYSTFHETAIYTLGYTHPETIRLAYMFCMTLDGIKTGMTVKPEVLKRDTAKYQKRPPVWKETDEDREKFSMTGNNEKNVTRPSNLGRFIMDELHKQAQAEGDERLSKLEKFFESHMSCKLDQELAAPWNEAWDLAQQKKDQLNESSMADAMDAIKKHVETVYDEHRNEIASPRKPSTRTSPKKMGGSSFTNLPIEVRQDKIRELSQKFASLPKPKDVFMLEQEIARLRASYAYIHDYNKRGGHYTRFPFDVAMRELGAIKAAAKGQQKTVCADFYEHFNIKHPKKHHI
ncbi:hypothetical protein CPC08DRAFT_701791 [Agrocybe pediades]|nr:hypothetical protein CPC08DRAFT_701791 [Agrocybe pediades]